MESWGFLSAEVMGDEEGTSNGGGTEGTEGFHYLKSEAMNSSSNNYVWLLCSSSVLFLCMSGFAIN